MIFSSSAIGACSMLEGNIRDKGMYSLDFRQERGIQEQTQLHRLVVGGVRALQKRVLSQGLKEGSVGA